ncbi:deoxyribodipyrimidine photo-lyase [Pedobacter polaris]|uniref:Deoxyribodipyrimidine photo-lyase n=1 Tax=Pedobacter polaris TaxID=2571273 RepID=A0A4U1CWE8_9SPHI|nr:deoxyribodipyrimidine photo-lyase [Pedobacter polaris]TKC13213.1 deoxyribodipyrimidine photo-lyase [Pedobacter polaris]
MKQPISICWLRRDLRLEDNAALYHALKGSYPVLLLFIFDKKILEKLQNKTDARVTFIYKTLKKLQEKLSKNHSSIIVKYGTPENVWGEILHQYQIKAVYTNHDYEPYATKRDDNLAEFLRSEEIDFYSFKDQVIFEKNEVVKADGKPYTVFTPYFRVWHKMLNDFYVKPYPSERYLQNLLPTKELPFPMLNEMGFTISDLEFPTLDFERKLDSYEKKRDYPAADATTHVGLHLRFGTVSIRTAAKKAIAHKAEKWLAELAWRDFYMMILWHFPHIPNKAFKPAYDNIRWRNNEKEFEAWCEGNTGYPLVDAGMRQLNESGFMHNRVRMVVASFLCKHLLIDWRWGEAYFAEKLLDYEQASNVGGWQWACGSGNDAAPYFRVFNPELQLKKFDPKMEYVFRWAPAYKLTLAPPQIVEHTFARDRVLKEYKKALT